MIGVVDPAAEGRDMMVSAGWLRLDEADTAGVPWQRWGPYLSERQCGTVGEDYGSGDNIRGNSAGALRTTGGRGTIESAAAGRRTEAAR